MGTDDSTSSRTATVIGFGCRTPAKVLSLLARVVRDCGVDRVVPVRSSGTEAALLAPPYRTFSRGPSGSSSTAAGRRDLVVYALPTVSASDHASYAKEFHDARSRAVSGGDDDVVVVTYDPSADVLSVDDEGEIAASLTDVSPRRARRVVAATLGAMAACDAAAAAARLANVDDDGDGDVVLVVGSGGREHALAVALARSPLVGRVLCCPGNGGTEREGGIVENVGSGQDHATVLEVVKTRGVATVVVGPEQPLVDGLVDFLAVECPKVKVFGPSKAAAELEASKAFTKDFLQEHSLPTAAYRNFTSVDDALAYVRSLPPDRRVVVKASGLAAGKGVLLPNTPAETEDAVRAIMSDRSFGAAGDTCVVEDLLTGPEASCLAVCDGTTARLLPAAQDHKRALDGDEGLNTGGMGAYAPAPCVTPALQEEIERMCVKTVEKMRERGTPYVGVLYAGMMLTPDGPYILEFNCRFGDPETQVVLPLLETDLYELVTACCTGTLDKVDVRFRERESAATVVCAAKGYPEAYPKGLSVRGLDDAEAVPGAKVYHAGTKLSDEKDEILTSGGRVLAVTGTGPDLATALGTAYRGVRSMDFAKTNDDSSHMHFRTDIAKGAVQRRLRVGVLGSTRGSALAPVIEAIETGELHAEIVAVLSNKKTAPILDKGRALGKTVDARFISVKACATREEYDAECTSALLRAGADVVLLVGYMRILSGSFTTFWNEGRCLNVHPSLLPRHAGGMDLAVHQAVLDAGETESGCTIHEVTEEVDGGPVVVQKVVPVDPKDTPETLKARVQPQEGPAFVEALQQYCRKHNIGPAPSSGTKKTLTYADAGVDIDAGNDLVDRIKPLCRATRRPGCDAALGGFGGLFDLKAAGYGGDDTVLIGATDGVGTKLRIAQATGVHHTVGIDLVAMCVNDLLVAGGEPLLFLDYYATGRLEVADAARVVEGIAEGCRRAGCGLIGGETAEMPSMYQDGDYDLAGFSVGAVNRNEVLPRGVGAGDVLLGLSSDGIHSNGFSLVRRLLDREGLGYGDACPWEDAAAEKTIGDSLLTPTRIYVKSCLPLLKAKVLHGMAHITGGGLLENLPRALPEGIVANVTGHPPLPPVFQWLKRASGLDDEGMLKTFNCGVGMVLIVPRDGVDEAKRLLASSGDDVSVYDLGVLEAGSGEQVKMNCRLV